jgi:hypothetical protein
MLLTAPQVESKQLTVGLKGSIGLRCTAGASPAGHQVMLVRLIDLQTTGADRAEE